jgi:hypothetical protein
MFDSAVYYSHFPHNDKQLMTKTPLVDWPYQRLPLEARTQAIESLGPILSAYGKDLLGRGVRPIFLVFLIRTICPMDFYAV